MFVVSACLSVSVWNVRVLVRFAHLFDNCTPTSVPFERHPSPSPNAYRHVSAFVASVCLSARVWECACVHFAHTSSIIALPFQFLSSDIHSLLQMHAGRKRSSERKQTCQVTQITVDALRNTCIRVWFILWYLTFCSIKQSVHKRQVTQITINALSTIVCVQSYILI